MGALAPVHHWIPEDDLLLKNAVEAGASLESLAKGAVHFSRRFTLQELQDRWHNLLYDPVVSAKASALMIEFERSALVPIPKPNKFGYAKESKRYLPEKRKAESIRSCYYAMRKRVVNEPFGSVDMNILDGAGTNDDHLSTGCMFGNPVTDNFGNQQSVFNIIPNSDCVTASPAFPIGLHNHDGDALQGSFNLPADFPDRIEENLSIAENHSIAELCQPNELPFCQLYEAEDLDSKLPAMIGQLGDNVGNDSSGFQNQVLTSVIPDCDLSFHNFGYSPTPPQLPDWSTIDGISVLTLPDFDHAENAQSLQNTSEFHVRGEANAMDTSGFGIVNLEDKTSCDNWRNSTPSTDTYLAELTKSLLDFTDDEEMLYMGPDGNETIDKSYFDGLSSLLLDTADDSDIPGNGVSEVPNTPEVQLPIPDGSHPRELSDKCVNHYGDKPLVCSSDLQMLSSALSVNPAFPEMRGGVICCMLNTEDPEIPSNDDVFLPVRMPSTDFPFVAHWKYDESYRPLSLSVKDISSNQKANDERAVLKKREQNSQLHSHIASRTIEPPVQTEKVNGVRKVKKELCKDGNQHMDPRSLNIAEIPSIVNSGNVSATNAIHGAVKENTLKAEQGNNFSRSDAHIPLYMGKNAVCTKQEQGSTTTLKKDEPTVAEDVLVKASIPDASANHIPSDSEEFSNEIDDDVPYFSVVEAMILNRDLSSNDQHMHSSKRVLRYQNQKSKRAIIKLDQGADAHTQRAIAAQGAFAVLCGRHSDYWIRKPEVLLGRATDDVKVDIDLGSEGHGSNFSRRQATLKMDTSGQFHLQNIGKFSIHVNGKPVLPKQSLILTPHCLIEVKEIEFSFETSERQIKQHIDNFKASQKQENKA